MQATTTTTTTTSAANAQLARNDLEIPTTPQPLLAFQEVMSYYQERQQSSGSVGTMDYEKSAQTRGNSDGLVRPDLIVEVEIAARKSLTPGQFAYWTAFYKTAKVVVLTAHDIAKDDGRDKYLEEHIATFAAPRRDAVRSLDTKVRMALGARLGRLAVYPLSLYLAPRNLCGHYPRSNGSKPERAIPAAYRDRESPLYNPDVVQ